VSLLFREYKKYLKIGLSALSQFFHEDRLWLHFFNVCGRALFYLLHTCVFVQWWEIVQVQAMIAGGSFSLVTQTLFSSMERKELVHVYLYKAGKLFKFKLWEHEGVSV
jgi:hypothetical protein